MLLWMSRGDGVVDLAGDEAFEAADDVLLGEALFGASSHVCLGSGVPAEPAERDAVGGGVGLSVAAAVESVSVGLSGGRGDRGDAAEHRERGFGVEPVGVLHPQ